MSLRKRLVLTMVGLLALALAASVGAVFGALQDWSGDVNDDVLASVGRQFREDLLVGAAPSAVGGPLRGAAEQGQVPSFFQVRTPDGRVRHTAAVGPVPDLADPLPAALRPVGLTAGNPDGERFAELDPDWLVRTSRLSEGGDIVVVAMRTGGYAELTSRVAGVALVTSGVALVALVLLSLRAVRRALRPLEGISATAAAIGSGDLSRRVEAGRGTEVARLGAALNAMLGQLESAFRRREVSEQRLRRFVADASHELRTPIATIRGYAELFRFGAASRLDDLATALSRIESEAERMGVLVDELLLLARLDQGRPLAAEPVALADLAADAVADARVASPGHAFELEAEPLVVVGDEDRLRQVLGNLLANVVQHTPAGTRAVVRVRADGDCAVLEVADDGPGVPPEHGERVFERFHRGTSERVGNQGGAGLGLSIVASVAEAHGGSAALAGAPGGGAVFTVRLPRRDP
jgi:two-component system OmpR family sensor kinase